MTDNCTIMINAFPGHVFVTKNPPDTLCLGHGWLSMGLGNIRYKYRFLCYIPSKAALVGKQTLKTCPELVSLHTDCPHPNPSQCLPWSISFYRPSLMYLQTYP